MIIQVKMLDGCDDLVPVKAHDSDAGFDLCSRGEYVMYPGNTLLIPTGVFLGLPVGWEAQIRPRSGLSLKTNIILPNSPGTIDAGYRNEINVIMRNTDECEEYVIKRGMRIAQMVIKEVPSIELVIVNKLDVTERNLKGFGSSGI